MSGGVSVGGRPKLRCRASARGAGPSHVYVRMVATGLVVALSGLTAVGAAAASGQATADSRYQDVSLADLVKRPRDFDQSLVRVAGVARFEFEEMTLWVAPQAMIDGMLDQAVWLDVGWPVSKTLNRMNRVSVIVEAKFDADRLGYVGCCRGTLTDIHSVSQPGFETEACVLNYETRLDALEQLESHTGWIDLGIRHGNAWTEATFTFAAGSSGTSDKRLPKPGDVIRVVDRQRIYIFDHATSGERYRLRFPLANGRHRAQRDETRLWLAPGAVVQVADVQTARVASATIVWARVVPSASNWGTAQSCANAVRSPQAGPVRKIHDVGPTWPEAARRANVRGQVIIEITIATDGTVANPRILKGIPLLNEAAIESVRQWRYEPVLFCGHPIPMPITVVVSFP